MPLSTPPTNAELAALCEEVVDQIDLLMAGNGSPQFCLLLAATIEVLYEKMQELIGKYNESCGTYVGPVGPGQP